MLYPIVQILSFLTLSLAVYVPNLDKACLKCICTASTTCDESFGCRQGYCGPFFIHRGYWENAKNITLNYNDDDYEACVHNYGCASKVVSNYMANNGRDCNGDGIIDCDDYARIHFFGEDRCTHPMDNNSYHERYVACMLLKRSDKKLNSK